MNGLRYIIFLIGVSFIFTQDPLFQFNESTNQAFYFFKIVTIEGNPIDPEKGKVNLVVLRHVLEHIFDLDDFLSYLKSIIINNFILINLQPVFLPNE